MTTRAVFSDVDGVLHSTLMVRGLDQVTRLALSTPDDWRQQGLFCWAQDLEEALREVDVSTGDTVPLVIHSTWRLQPWLTLPMMRKALGPLGHRLMAMTSPDLAREASILDLVQRAGIDEFLVLDDSVREFSPGAIANLLITDPLTGASDPQILQAVRHWSSSSPRDCALPIAVA